MAPRPGRPHRVPRALRSALLLPLVAVFGATSLTRPLPAAAAPTDLAVIVHDGSFRINGAGFGHGWGMSQYGAYGAAIKGLTWKQILAFYYQGTKRATLDPATRIRVKISADDNKDVTVLAAPGMRLTDLDGTKVALPKDRKHTFYKIIRSGSSFKLLYHGKGESSYRTYRLTKAMRTERWTLSSSDSKITIVLPYGVRQTVRGKVSAAAYLDELRTVNGLTLQNYLRSVVPSEMPTSWAPAAVAAQAVAARSYAIRTKATAGSIYDICDTTMCQVYKGFSSTTSYGTTYHETGGGDAAIEATAGVVLTYKGAVAFTQFASSNGGASAQGDYPYLAPEKDPYDGVVTSQAWQVTLTASRIQAVYPSVGTVQALQVTRRDGSGRYGGRVESITVIGNRDSVKVNGRSFQYAFGMRSSLYRVVTPPTP